MPATRLIGQTIEKVEKVDSTNLYLKRKLEKKIHPMEGLLVWAWEQTHGAGLDNNHWESEAGKNLTFSFFLKPEFLPASDQFLLNMAVSLGVWDFVDQYVPDNQITIKWPNDIYINDRKVAGMLIQHAVSGNALLYTIVGIGININQRKFGSEIPNAVSLNEFVKEDLNLQKCLTDLCKKLDRRYQQLERQDHINLKAAYEEKLFGMGVWRKYKYDNETLLAKITGIESFGLLRLETENKGELICDLKQISFVL